jgi:hypothetical protein
MELQMQMLHQVPSKADEAAKNEPQPLSEASTPVLKRFKNKIIVPI